MFNACDLLVAIKRTKPSGKSSLLDSPLAHLKKHLHLHDI